MTDKYPPTDEQPSELPTDEPSLLDRVEEKLIEDHGDDAPERDVIAQVLDGVLALLPDEPSPWRRVEVWENPRGQGFYLPIHRNGEPGPRSEPYESGLSGAKRAAAAAFPGVPRVDVTRQ